MVGSPSAPTRTGRGRAWLLASRPKTLAAAVAPVLVGTGLAVRDGVFAPGPAAMALLGAVLIQIATNLANDYYDFQRGGDTEERVGPVRVTQAGILPPATVRRGMIIVLALALLTGVYLVAVAGWPIVWIGLASLACAVLYTGGPFPLAYHGLGDLFVFLFFGVIAVGGTYFVQGLAWPPGAVLAGVGVGALSTAILVVNNLRDRETDARAGKRTLAVRIGATATKAQYLALLLIAFLVPGVGVVRISWPVAVLVVLAALPLSIAPARRVVSSSDPRGLLPALGETARVLTLYGLLLGGALAFG